MPNDPSDALRRSDDFQRSGADTAPAWAVSLFVTSLALWVGAAAFLTAGVMPALFLNLAPSEAGHIASLVFPIYFRAGLVVGLVASLAAGVLSRGGGRRWQATLALLLVMTAAQGWSALVVHPEMARIRGVDAEASRFQQLHRLSVRLNGVVLAGGLVLVGAGGFLLSRRRDQA